jgi:hypothetical protein
MNRSTVTECDKRLLEELDAAKRATSYAERARHLDRAARLAHCSEKGRLAAVRAGLSPTADLACSLAGSGLD